MRGVQLSVELLDLALEAARAAATEVRRRVAGGIEVAATKSSDTDPVTEADRASERLIRRLVLDRRPGDGFLGEEGDDVPSRSGVRWIVDPVDGTVNLLYGIPSYAVSIAAEVDGEVRAGVVLDVVVGREYTAAYDGESPPVARCDGVPIAVRPPAPLAERLLATGFSYEPAVRARQAQALTHLLPRVRDIRRIGSCALDLCRVAEGSVDGYLEEGVHPWDHAAGGLVARAAGAAYEISVGSSGLPLLLCGPAHGFEGLRMAAREAGYYAESPGLSDIVAGPFPGE